MCCLLFSPKTRDLSIYLSHVKTSPRWCLVALVSLVTPTSPAVLRGLHVSHGAVVLEMSGCEMRCHPRSLSKYVHVLTFYPLHIQLKAFLTRLASLLENISLWSSGNTSSLVTRGPPWSRELVPKLVGNTAEGGSQVSICKLRLKGEQLMPPCTGNLNREPGKYDLVVSWIGIEQSSMGTPGSKRNPCERHSVP